MNALDYAIENNQMEIASYIRTNFTEESSVLSFHNEEPHCDLVLGTE